MARIYSVTCRHCGCLRSFRSGPMSDEKVRKQLIRDGWDIGRHTKAHTCPACQHKPKNAPSAPKEEVAQTTTAHAALMPSLEEVWAATSENDRVAFARKIYDEFFAHEPASGVDARTQPDENDTEPPVIDDDAEAADWWLEIHNGAVSGATR